MRVMLDCHAKLRPPEKVGIYAIDSLITVI
jgi:hypothetical protein